MDVPAVMLAGSFLWTDYERWPYAGSGQQWASLTDL